MLKSNKKTKEKGKRMSYVVTETGIVQNEESDEDNKEKQTKARARGRAASVWGETQGAKGKVAAFCILHGGHIFCVPGLRGERERRQFPRRDGGLSCRPSSMQNIPPY
jgi:hypothetical protein